MSFLRPCRSPYCECDIGQCANPGFYNAGILDMATKPITAANAKQVDGEHYKKYGDLQPWDVIVAWKMDYLTGTALKYIARWKDKGGIKDLEKAIHFLEKQIEVAKAAEKSNQFTQAPGTDC